MLVKETTQDIKQLFPRTLVSIGGAPVNDKFCKKIGANHYSPDPQGVMEFLNRKTPKDIDKLI